MVLKHYFAALGGNELGIDVKYCVTGRSQTAAEQWTEALWEMA